MPKRTDIKSIMIIGAGPIVIGQACEFDYSGAQACKALRAEGYRVILVNSNPATIMTDPGLADATYIEPITPEVVEKIIAREKPDALLPTMGGQTALNTAMQLHASGALERHGVELIGAKADVIDRAEDRLKFRDAMAEIGIESPRSAIAHTMEEARAALAMTGLPSVIRPSFTLGGTGGGIAYNKEEFEQIVAGGLEASPTTEVLIEESVLGWKEYEMEVVRDSADNCIIICSIENVDPMGIHTGDSVTVAPALTLTDKEYQIMRDASIACLRKIGVDTGGSNVQFGLNPADGRMVVIEMNPRVSRSSALASKATGFPIAKIAAKLAVGYTLDELTNDITMVTPASFEPTIDYVVVKIPRFTFEKFPGTPALLTTSMKSVGEAMAIGRSFAEALQKGLRSMETGLSGLDAVEPPGDGGPDAFRAALSSPTPDRLLIAGQALRAGLSVEDIHEATKFDPWFLRELERIVAAEREVAAIGLPREAGALRRLKALGFSDKRLARTDRHHARRMSTAPGPRSASPRFISASTPARASSPPTRPTCIRRSRAAMATPVCEADPTDRDQDHHPGRRPEPHRPGDRVRLLLRPCRLCAEGCRVRDHHGQLQPGNRQHRLRHIRPAVFRAADRGRRHCPGPPRAAERHRPGLHRPVRRPDAAETVAGACRAKTSRSSAPRPTRSTWPRTASGSSSCCNALACCSRTTASPGRPRKPTPSPNASATRWSSAPAMCWAAGRWRSFTTAPACTATCAKRCACPATIPVLIDRYLNDAIEVDVDCICDGETVYVAGVMEHIEEAGIHSGDSACSLPPYSLSPAMITELKSETEALAKALGVVGLMNVQYAIKDDTIYVLEVNPRASRTVPFVAKATGVPVAKIGARVMAGAKLATDFKLDDDFDRPACRGQGSGLPVRPLPQRGHDPGAGDEIHRRGHGSRFQLRARLRQGAAWRRRHPADGGPGVPVDQGRRQEGPAVAGPPAERDGVFHLGHPWHRRPHPRGWLSGDRGEQGAGRPAALRRRDPFGRNSVGDQHRIDAAIGRRQLRHTPQRADPWRAALHNPGGCAGRGSRDCSIKSGNA